MNLIFATHNAHKVSEIRKLMPKGIVVFTLSEIGLTEDIPETAKTLEGNASLKSSFVVRKYDLDCFADDTGLEIESLEGEPGVFSARYAGDQKDSEANMDLVLEKLKGQFNRRARFRTVISLRLAGAEYLFEGIVNGSIRTEKSGKDGFGYDPIFQPDGDDRTFSEMLVEEKNALSHRGQAIRELTDFLSNRKSFVL